VLLRLETERSILAETKQEEVEMIYKFFCAKKRVLFSLFSVFFLVIHTVFVCVLSFNYGRKAQAYLPSPTHAWQAINLIEVILEERKQAPDCILELFLSAEIGMRIDSAPGWKKMFFSKRMKKHEAHNEGILKILKSYRDQYPLTEAYYAPCKGSEFFDIFKERNEEAWNYIYKRVAEAESRERRKEEVQ
jgi:hypothetical protein